MSSTIDFGKTFLETYFHKHDATAVKDLLADDLVWITSRGLYHLRTAEEVEDFLTRQMEEHPGACHVDIISIKSPPGPRESVNVAYEVNLVPVEAERGVYLRVQLAVRQLKDRREINFVGFSHRYENTEAIRGDMEELYARIREKEEDVQKQLKKLSAEKEAQESALQEEVRRLEEEKDAWESVNETALAEARQHAAAEIEKMQAEVESALREVRDAAESEMAKLLQQQEDRKELDRVEIRNELEREYRRELARLQEEHRTALAEKERLLTIAKEQAAALEAEAQTREEEQKAALDEKEQALQEALAQSKAWEDRHAEADAALQALQTEKDDLVKRTAELKTEAEHARADKLRGEEILRHSQGDRQQIAEELTKATERLKQTMRHTEKQQTAAEQAAMRDMVSMIGALAAEMRPHDKVFDRRACLQVVELYAGEDCAAQGARLLPIECDGAVPQTVCGDKARLQMVLLNVAGFLCRAACAHPPADRPVTLRMRVAANRPVRGMAYLRFVLEDNADAAAELVGPDKEKLAYTTAMLGVMGGGLQVRLNAQGKKEAVVTANLSV